MAVPDRWKRPAKAVGQAKRFHEAVSASSAQQSAKPMGSFWARTHFWWKPVVEGAATHAGWLEVYRGYGRFEKEDGVTLKGGTSFGSEFARWEAGYPVPEHLRRLR